MIAHHLQRHTVYNPQGTTQTTLVPCHPHQISTLNDLEERRVEQCQKQH